MKSIFLGSKVKILKVYPEKTIQYLKEKAGLNPYIPTREEILAGTFDTKDVEYIFSTWGMPVFSEEEIQEVFPKVKAVFYGAGSVQRFARPFLHRGIRVFSAWMANGVPVAEYTVSQIILANKGYFSLSRSYDQKSYQEAKSEIERFRGNYGATVGLIGAGTIGKMVISRLRDYRLNVIVFDPFLSDEKAKELGVEKCSLEEVFSRSQVISNHLANNEQTKGMLNGHLFSLMSRNSVFLNTGRGAQVVEDDLVHHLKNRTDVTAILDVTYPEPPCDGHAFYSLPNCILTPHIAGSFGDEVERMSEYMVEEFNRLISGEETRFEVSEKMLETMA